MYIVLILVICACVVIHHCIYFSVVFMTNLQGKLCKRFLSASLFNTFTFTPQAVIVHYLKVIKLSHFSFYSQYFQTTLCYYDAKDALGLDPEHPEACRMMKRLQKVAQDNKRQAMQLNLTGKHREALQKISIAIETDPAVADFHVLR